jgi:hypothetical protein
MPSSRMIRRVALVRTDVLAERIASIIRVTRIGELGTMLAVLCTTILSTQNYLSLCAINAYDTENIYSETLIYRPRMYRFPGSIFQFLWSLNKCYLSYVPHVSFSRIHRSFSGPRSKTMIPDFTMFVIKRAVFVLFVLYYMLHYMTGNCCM